MNRTKKRVPCDFVFFYNYNKKKHNLGALLYSGVPILSTHNFVHLRILLVDQILSTFFKQKHQFTFQISTEFYALFREISKSCLRGSYRDLVRLFPLGFLQIFLLRFFQLILIGTLWKCLLELLQKFLI